MSKYLDSDGLLYLWTKVKEYVTSKVPTKTSQITNDSGFITASDVPAAVTIDTSLSSTSTNPVQNKVINTALGNKVDKVSGKGLSTNDYTTAEKTKLAGIETGANAYTLPTATSSVLGGVKTGSNITNSSGTISITKANVTTALGYTPPTTNTTYSAATTSAAGLMSAADKEKLDGIAEGANAYTLPAATNSTLGGVKLAIGISGGADEGWAVGSDDEDGCLYVMPTNASTSAAGLMTASMVTKLNGIATGANNYTLPTASSTLGGVKTTSTVTSTSGLTAVPIISGVPYYKNTTYSAATTSANGLMSSTDKAKLDAFSAASNYALKTDITGLYKYKGSKATTGALPTSGNAVGDVWNVEAGGMNYVWTGSAWDALGEVFTIDAITNSEIDTIVAS